MATEKQIDVRHKELYLRLRPNSQPSCDRKRFAIQAHRKIISYG